MTIQPSYVKLTQTLYKELKATDTITCTPASLNIETKKPDGFISYEMPALNISKTKMIKNPEYTAALTAVKKTFSITADILALSFLQFLDSEDNSEQISDGNISITFINKIADDPNNARTSMNSCINFFSTMCTTLKTQTQLNPEMKKCLAELPRFLATLRNMYGIYE